MKDKLIKLENGNNLCVLDELEYNDKKYVLTIECALENEEVVNNYKVYEISLENDSLTLNTVNNKDTLSYVTNMFLNNIKNI